MSTATVNKDQLTFNTIVDCARKGKNIYELSVMIGHSVADTCKILRDIAADVPDFRKFIKKKTNWPLNLHNGHIYTGAYSTPVIENPEIKNIDSQIAKLIKNNVSNPKIIDNPEISAISARISEIIKNQLVNPDIYWLSKVQRLKNYKKTLPLKVSEWSVAAKLLLEKKRNILKNSPTTGGPMIFAERMLNKLGKSLIQPGSHVFVKPIRGKDYSEIYLPVATKQRLFRFGHLKNGVFELAKRPDGKPRKSATEWFSKEDILADKVAQHAATYKYTVIQMSKSVRTVFSPDSTSLGAISNKNLVPVSQLRS